MLYALFSANSSQLNLPRPKSPERYHPQQSRKDAESAEESRKQYRQRHAGERDLRIRRLVVGGVDGIVRPKARCRYAAADISPRIEMCRVAQAMLSGCVVASVKPNIQTGEEAWTGVVPG